MKKKLYIICGILILMMIIGIIRAPSVGNGNGNKAVNTNEYKITEHLYDVERN